MFKQSLRPLARARPASTARAVVRSRLQVRYNSTNQKPGSWSDNSGSSSSSHSTTGNSRSVGDWIIPGSMVVVAVAIGSYFYVPVSNDIHQGHHGKSKGGPDIAAGLLDGVKALEPERDVRKSVLDQESLHVPIHSREVKESVKAKKDLVPETVEKKAEEAKEPAQTAFNEETGEINWDCPCLGGMADGPCGEQFKAAFSCFVYSDKEPKGVECVEKFKHMQDCFREHPDVYGEEIDDDDEEPADGPSSVKSRPDSQRTPPAPPKKEPPQGSEILATTPETTPSKGVGHILPTEKRADKAPGGITPPVGEGTVPKPYTGKDKP